MTNFADIILLIPFAQHSAPCCSALRSSYPSFRAQTPLLPHPALPTRRLRDAMPCFKRPRPPPSSRPSKRTRHHSMLLPASSSLPELPTDVWRTIASHLPPHSLAVLSETSTTNYDIAQGTIDTQLWRALFPSNNHYRSVSQSSTESRALASIINLLDHTPSLRPKCVAHQARSLCSAYPPPLDSLSCFTPDQAAAFLGVARNNLLARSPARVAPRRGGRKRGFYAFHFQAFPPDPRFGELRTHVFGLREVLQAARETHGNMPAVLNFVHVAVVKDKLRFARAQMAEAAVRTCASERGFEPRDVEYVLNASSEVAEFRSGMWNLLYDDYCTRVRQLVAVHCALGRCYRCLLSCDGNARLKAKRIVGKILRNGQFDTAVVVRALEGNLWWAKSRTNVKKMEEMGRRMQKIRA